MPQASPQSSQFLGYGKQTAATLDQANIWMRGQPWYQQQLRAWGQDPGHPHALSDAQRHQLLKLAQANGMVVNEGAQEIDDHGNFRDTGMGLGKKILIGAAIGGAALTGLGVVGIGPLAGTFGGAAGAAGGGVGVGETAATGVGGLSATSLGLPVTADLGSAGAGLGATAATVSGLGLTDLERARQAAGSAPGDITDASQLAGGTRSGIPNWLSPILSSAIPAVGQIVGAGIQSSSITEAAKIQAESIANALAFEKQQYADLVGRLTPYIAAGTTSTDRMTQLLGLPARPSTTAAPWPGPAGPSDTGTGGPAPSGRTISTTEPVAAPVPLPTPQTPTPTTVLVRSPDGTTMRRIPIETLDHWKSLGATEVA